MNSRQYRANEIYIDLFADDMCEASLDMLQLNTTEDEIYEWEEEGMISLGERDAMLEA